VEPHKTVLVLVSGAPGTGKTTLAKSLAEQLRFPLLARDHLKETLMNGLGAPDRAASQSIGRASFALLYAILDVLVDRVPGVIAEANFARGLSEADLSPFVTRARAVLLHCETSPSKVTRRIQARPELDGRHAGHHDLEALPSVLDRIAQGAFEPLDLAVPILTIDTTEGYAPPLPDIVQFVQETTH
jgi:predicted kinase